MATNKSISTEAKRFSSSRSVIRRKVEKYTRLRTEYNVEKSTGCHIPRCKLALGDGSIRESPMLLSEHEINHYFKTMKRHINKLTSFLGLQPDQSSLIGAMNELSGEDLANTKTRMVAGLPLDLGAPYKPFPNVTRFEIVVSKMDELFLKFGIKKRLEKAGFKYTVYKNRDLNRYVAHQLIRFRKLTDEQYGNLAYSHMSRSRVWYMMAVRHVFPLGHREMPGGAFLKLRRSVLKIFKDEFSTMQFARVYLEKPSGGGRPLGVPKPAWRIYLNMFLRMVEFRLKDKLKVNQHAYISGRGVLTAGKDILANVIQQDYIYEFDLRGYFDNLNLGYLHARLKDQFHMTPKVLNRIRTLNQSVVDLATEDKIFERDRKIVANREGKINENGKGPYRDGVKHYAATYGANGEEHKKLFTDEQRQYIYKQYVSLVHPVWKGYLGPTLRRIAQRTQGVPQGGNLSPFLSNISLDQSLLKAGTKIVQYADDGIIYGSKEDFTGSRPDEYRFNPTELTVLLMIGLFLICIGPGLIILIFYYKPAIRDFEVKFTPEETIERIFKDPEVVDAGIIQAPEKSGWIKKDGVGQRPLKFLGLEYDGRTDELKANTRKGSKLIYDKASLLEAKEAGIYTNFQSIQMENRPSGERFTLSKYAGGVMSRLYNGSGNQDEYFQNFNLNFAKGTGVAAYVKGAKGAEKQQTKAINESIALKQFKDKDLNEEDLEEFKYEDFRREFMKLTVFNSTSIATRSALEAIRLAEGMPVRQPKSELKRHETPVPTERGDGMNYNKYQKMNILRGQRAYAGSLKNFREFLEKEISRMTPYSKFTPREMGVHYQSKYVSEKIRLMELHIRRTELLILEVRLKTGLRVHRDRGRLGSDQSNCFDERRKLL